MPCDLRVVSQDGGYLLVRLAACQSSSWCASSIPVSFTKGYSFNPVLTNVPRLADGCVRGERFRAVSSVRESLFSLSFVEPHRRDRTRASPRGPLDIPETLSVITACRYGENSGTEVSLQAATLDCLGERFVWFASFTVFQRGASLSRIVGVMVVTKDVAHEHPDKPDQSHKQRPYNCLCHGSVSLHRLIRH